jgi:hypothetical protein
MGYCYYRPWKTDNKLLTKDFDGSCELLYREQALTRLYFGEQMFTGITIMVWNKLYRREFLLRHDLKFAEGYIYEDTEFTPKAFYFAKNILLVNKLFYTYNIHLGAASTSGMKKSLLTVKSSIEMSKRTANFFREHYIARVTERTASIYHNALLNAYHTCFVNRKNKEMGDLRSDIVTLAKTEQPEFEKRGLGFKERLFFISPQAFSYLTTAVRIAKRIPYNIKKFITGKN